MENLSTCVEDIKSRLARCYQDSYVLTEADTIRILIMPVLRALGWNTEEPSEVKSEYRTRSGDNPVDCALFIEDRPCLFIEAKSLREDVRKRSLIAQTLSYASVSGVRWCVLTNGREWNLYNTHHQADASEKLFFSVDLTSSGPEDIRCLSLLSRTSLGSNRLDQEWREQEFRCAAESALNGLLDDPKIISLILGRSGKKDMPRYYIRKFLKEYEVIRTVKDADSDINTCIPDDPPQKTDTGTIKRSTYRPRVRSMFEAGILKSGMRLRIMGCEDRSEAFIHDETNVLFNGNIVSYNSWGCQVTGWSAIQIYLHAITDDGRTLEELRTGMTSKEKPRNDDASP